MADPKPSPTYNVVMQEMVGALQENPRSRFLTRENLRTQANQMAQTLVGEDEWKKRTPAFREHFVEQALEQGAPPLNDKEMSQMNLERFGPLIGAMGGAVYGGTKAGPTGAVVGGTMGALGGIAAPELTQRMLSPDIPSFGQTNPRGLMRKMFAEGVTSTLFGAGSELAMKVASKYLGQMRSRFMLGDEGIDAGTKQANQIIQARGGHLTPTMLAGPENVPSGVNFLENVAQHGIWSKKQFTRLFGANDKALLQYADDVSKSFANALSPDELSVVLTDTIKGGDQAATAISSTMHGVVDTIGKGVKVPTSEALSTYRNMLSTVHGQKLKDLVTLQDDMGASKTLDDFLTFTIAPPRHVPPRGSVQQPFQQPGGPSPAPQPTVLNEASFKAVDKARSELLRVGRLTKRSTDPVVLSAGKAANKLAFQLGEALDVTAQTLPKDVQHAYKAAKQFTFEMKSVFNDQLVLDATRAVLKDRDAFLRTFFSRSKLGTLKAIKRIDEANAELRKRGGQKILQDRAKPGTKVAQLDPVMPEMRKVFGEEIVNRSMVKDALGNNVRLDGQRLKRLMFDPSTGLGEKVIETVFTPSHIQSARQMANAIDVAARRAEGPGRIVIQLAQDGAAIGALTGAVSGLASLVGLDSVAGGKTDLATATVILLGPRQIGKLFTNKAFTDNLTKGLMGGPKSDAFRRLLTQVAVIEPDLAGNILPSPLTEAAKGLKAVAPQLIDPGFDRQGRPIPTLASGQ